MRLVLLAISCFLLSCHGAKKTSNDSQSFTTNGSGCAPKLTGAYVTDKPAPIIPGLEYFEFPITTSSKKAQQYFNQGWGLAAGFNHAEAARSFYWATNEDPNCAMCYWGLAYVLGPNYNAGMSPEVVADAVESINTAQLLSSACTAKERDLIEAMSLRYPATAGSDRSKADEAYSIALGKVYNKYPTDNDIAALYAESIMDLHPWTLWDENNAPFEWTREILTVLEGIIERDPGHVISNHMYIHAVEASRQPEMGNDAAVRLETAVPGSGHLVHMPSHIYIRTGDYRSCSDVNKIAITIDSIYVSACHAAGAYPLSYYPHNFHFLCACAALEGDGQMSLSASLRMQEKLDTDVMREDGWGTIQHYYTIPYYIMVKFEMWSDIMKVPLPDDELKYPQGVLHYARGMAMISEGDDTNASAELLALKATREAESVESITIWDINDAKDLLDIAILVLESEINRNNGDQTLAEQQLLFAITIEDALNYNEPPDWFFSVRHYLGDLYLQEGRLQDAQRVYESDLENFPGNGWALHGLYETLKKQGKEHQAERVYNQFEQAWERADVELKGSRVL